MDIFKEINEFNKAYWLSKQPAVRELKDMDRGDWPTEDKRAAKAVELAMKGFIIDNYIDAWGMDPYYTMKLRQEMHGFKWVPSALQNPVDIGLMMKLPVPFDAIKVSTDIKDFPPIDPPQTSSFPPAPSKLVGAYAIGNLYYCLPAGLLAPKDKEITEDGKKFKKIVIPNAIATHLWELIS